MNEIARKLRNLNPLNSPELLGLELGHPQVELSPLILDLIKLMRIERNDEREDEL